MPASSFTDLHAAPAAGPGLVIAVSGSAGALVFVASMGIGMLIVARLQRTPVSTDDTLPETEEGAEPCG